MTYSKFQWNIQGVPEKMTPVKYKILVEIGKRAFLKNAFLVVTYFHKLNYPKTGRYILILVGSFFLGKGKGFTQMEPIVLIEYS